MANFSRKTKLSKKPTKKARKSRSNVPIRPSGYFELTAEDIAETNMFAAAIAKANWQQWKPLWAKTVAEWKKFQKDKPPIK